MCAKKNTQTETVSVWVFLNYLWRIPDSLLLFLIPFKSVVLSGIGVFSPKTVLIMQNDSYLCIVKL